MAFADVGNQHRFSAVELSLLASRARQRSRRWVFLAGSPIHDDPVLAEQLLPATMASQCAVRSRRAWVVFIGTALLGRSPDGTGRAVFCVVAGDGSIVQEHTEKALEGLSPVGTVEPLVGRCWHPAEDAREHDGGGRGGKERDPLPRLGVIANSAPRPTRYVSQPFDDSINVIDVGTGGPAGNEVFLAGSTRVLRSRALDQPVDLAPVSIETGNANQSGNTTMTPGTDF